MKISIGMKIQDGPFGGGNQFSTYLTNFLKSKGHEVIDHLNDSDIDIILLTDPRTNLISNSYGVSEIINYTRNNDKAILIQRINECDERKGTKLVNKQLSFSNKFMDHTVFIASWLPDLFKNKGYKFTDDSTVILNGANENIFSIPVKEHQPEKLKIVTHHWGASYLKGWDIYLELDKLLNKEKYNHLEFHYIGNPLKNAETKNIIYHQPCNGKDLASKLSDCDIYVTGSINEPAGMHHIEGAMSGLPLIYRNSGALPEYCKGFGEEFNGVEDFEAALDRMLDNYQTYRSIMPNYENTALKMANSYLELFENLVDRKDKILSSRNNSKFSYINELNARFFYFLHNKIYPRLKYV